MRQTLESRGNLVAIGRVLVTGATGFVGGRLIEIMSLTGCCTPRAFIHATNSAARISRFPLDFALGDLCDAGAVRRAMDGCEAVVHLAFGSEPVMTRGLKNVLGAASDRGVRRFVHISSAAIYGNDPSPESQFETARPTPENAYQRIKVKQERLVATHSRRSGLPVVVLRPFLIYGPYSHLMIQYLNRIQAGTMVLVDEGRNPCNLVYVDNLCQAILLALVETVAPGETFFVGDRESTTWAQFLGDLAALVGAELPSVRSAELTPRPRQRLIHDSVYALPKVLVSDALRGSLRPIPLYQRLEAAAYRWFESLAPERREALRDRIKGPEVIPGREDVPERPCLGQGDNLIAMQGRRVAHSCQKAGRILGYSAPVPYHEAMDLTASWLRFAHLV
jgi:nucleoside-diphosphate-sugar epimerase